MTGSNFEASANISDWPPNVPGKPTQAAVFGACHATRGKVFEILWTGKFPDLDPAMYWAAKKEVQAIKGDWIMASRVLWQHDLTPEQAVEAIRKTMEPQVDAVLQQMNAGAGPDEMDLGPGPMKKVDPDNVQGYYVEVVDENNPQGDPLASFFAAPPTQDIELEWDMPGEDDDEDAETE